MANGYVLEKCDASPQFQTVNPTDSITLLTKQMLEFGIF